jgi:hypothetical protein
MVAAQANLDAETQIPGRDVGQLSPRSKRGCPEAGGDGCVTACGQAASRNSIRVLDSNAELAVAYAELC